MSSYSDQIEISIHFFFNLKPDIREQSSQSSMISDHKTIVSQYERKSFALLISPPLIKSQNNALTENLSFSEPY